MFESVTYEVILQRMINNVLEQNPNLDTREGSVIFTALAPAAVELQNMYIELDALLNETFAGTATREYLIRRADEVGIEPNAASKAVLRGEFNIDVPIGSRFNLDEVNFQVTEKIQDHVFKLQCETAGVIGNNKIGALIPIDYIDGLTSAKITEVLIPGEEEEDTETFRTRYFSQIKNSAVDANTAQYQKWANEYTGVGKCKVFPLWNGVNTVKVSILNADQGVASASLIADFQKYLDPGSQGLGNGAAPIGAVVTVSTATAITISVRADVILAAGYSEVSGINEAVTEYLKGLAYSKNTVSFIGLGAAILDVPCVEGIQNLKVNDGTADIPLTSEQIPVFGTGTWTVVT